MNDARLRKATEMEKRMALGRLFSALPVRQGDPKDQIEVYVLALRDVTHHALDEIIFQAISGQHPKLAKRFAPTTAELGEAVRDEMDRIVRQVELAQERMQIADNRPKPVPHRTIWQRQAEAKQRMQDEGRQLVRDSLQFTDVKAAMRDMPAGSTYIAILGAVYGPPGFVPEPDQVPEPATQDIPW